jgi:cytochrome P450
VSATDVLDGPADPLAAVTHPDPYPYYARLRAERPVRFDATLDAWIVADAAGVLEALAHPACRVRPPAEPVPAALAGSPAGELFGRLVRMNDGEAHARLKPAVSQALAFADLGALEAVAEAQADRLLDGLDPARPAEITAFAFALPARTIGAWIGIAEAALARLPALLDGYVSATAPSASAEELAAGGAAADELLALAGEALDRRRLFPAEVERAAAVANAAGLLVQAWEGTASAIGSTLLALARHPAALAEVRERPGLALAAVEETLRWDPFVQVMRRWLAADACIAGRVMRAGEALLLLSGSAARDPALDPDHPDAFDLHRRTRRSLAFGAGAHACPAHAVAPRIAAVGVRRLLKAGVRPERLAAAVGYRRSPFRTRVFG